MTEIICGIATIVILIGIIAISMIRLEIAEKRKRVKA